MLADKMAHPEFTVRVTVVTVVGCAYDLIVFDFIYYGLMKLIRKLYFK